MEATLPVLSNSFLSLDSSLSLFSVPRTDSNFSCLLFNRSSQTSTALLGIPHSTRQNLVLLCLPRCYIAIHGESVAIAVPPTVSTSAEVKMRIINDRERSRQPLDRSLGFRVWSTYQGLTQDKRTQERLMNQADATLLIAASGEILPATITQMLVSVPELILKDLLKV